MASTAQSESQQTWTDLEAYRLPLSIQALMKVAGFVRPVSLNRHAAAGCSRLHLHNTGPKKKKHKTSIVTGIRSGIRVRPERRFNNDDARQMMPYDDVNLLPCQVLKQTQLNYLEMEKKKCFFKVKKDGGVLLCLKTFSKHVRHFLFF